MHVALIGTYPPTACGIATFTADVENSLIEAGVEVTVFSVLPAAALPTARTIRDDHRAMSRRIVRDDRSSYTAAATEINNGGFDAVLIEHEFGIFGGHDGSHLLDLVNSVTVPISVTLHTVLSPFTAGQTQVIHQLCRRAAAVTVFTATARRLLLEQETCRASSIRIVPHGAPIEMYDEYDADVVRRQFGLGIGRPVLTTFGLLSPGKGIDLALDAMTDIVAANPAAVYVIAGRTHPEVERRHGETYRSSLERKVDELGLGGHVIFLDRFLAVSELAELLSVTDVFCTPYAGSDQIVSGALTFAVAAGCPAVSTPYRYAQDILADGAGTLVDFGDARAFAAAVNALLLDGPIRTQALRAAHRVAESMAWPAVGRTIAELLLEISAPSRLTTRRTAPVLASRPRRGLDVQLATLHLDVLTDDTAVFQHARGLVPRLEEGYCVDDVGRMLPISARLAQSSIPAIAARWHVNTSRQLAYLRSAAGPNGTMRNFMSWDRRWLDQPIAGDHVGRAVWGLGEMAAMESLLSADALELMLDLTADFDAASAPTRTLAYTALGLSAAAHLDPEAMRSLERMRPVMMRWKLQVDRTWHWFEPRLSYDNPRMAEALLRVGTVLGDPAMIDNGTELLGWLDAICQQGDHYRFPGHLGVEASRDVRWSGDEQPLEATAMADAHAAAWSLTRSSESMLAVDRAWSWFLGNNRLGVAVGNAATGACFDGLGPHDVNRNCGAESTLSFHRCAHTHRSVKHASISRNPAPETARVSS